MCINAADRGNFPRCDQVVTREIFPATFGVLPKNRVWRYYIDGYERMPKGHPKRGKRIEKPLTGLDLKLAQLVSEQSSAVHKLAASYVPPEVKRLMYGRRGRVAPWSTRLIAALLNADDTLAGANVPH